MPLYRVSLCLHRPRYDFEMLQMLQPVFRQAPSRWNCSRGLRKQTSSTPLRLDVHSALLLCVERRPFMLISRRTHHPSPFDVRCELWDRWKNSTTYSVRAQGIGCCAFSR
jgi:hypothetical protein